MDNSRFQFKPSTHTYTLDGKRMTGVTTVLGVIAKPALIQWAADMACQMIEDYSYTQEALDGDLPKLREIIKEARVAHRKKKEKAGEQGTDTHAEVEKVVKEAIANTNGIIIRQKGSAELPPQIDNFIIWATDNKIKFIESEKVMYSEEWFVGGTTDLVFEQDGKRYVGDIKTMKKMWDRVPYFQCAAYMKMLKENEPAIKYDGSCIINISKETNQVETFYSYDWESDLKAFESALTLYRALQNEV